MNTKQIISLLSLVCLLHSGFAQEYQKNDFSNIRIPSYEMTFDSTIYMAFQRIIEANQPFSYITFFPRVNAIGSTRTLPLIWFSHPSRT